MRLGEDFYAYTPLGKSYSFQVHIPEPTPNVRFMYDRIVDGPTSESTPSGRRVTGVTLRDRESLGADLVIDATGRNSSSARWLASLGYNAAPETYVNCDVHYATTIVKPKVWDAFEGVVFFVMPTGAGEHGTRMGSVVKLDDGRWLVGLGGRYGDAPPSDWDAFRQFGATLHHSSWTECVGTVEQLTPIATYRMPRAVRRHYEDIASYPDGLLPLGDSVCFFNPTHGQDMSSAAGQCRALRRILHGRAAAGSGLGGLGLQFFPAAAEWVRGPWILAAASDFAEPKCTGDFPNEDLPDLMRLVELAASGSTDPAVMKTVFDVALLRTPLSAVRHLAPTG